MTRTRVLYSGRVQGVGFRATTAMLARGMAVCGFVRNLDDGRVELIAEGAAAEIDRLLGAIAAHFGDMIRDARRTDESAAGGFGGFEIRP